MQETIIRYVLFCRALPKVPSKAPGDNSYEGLHPGPPPQSLIELQVTLLNTTQERGTVSSILYVHVVRMQISQAREMHPKKHYIHHAWRSHIWGSGQGKISCAQVTSHKRHLFLHHALGIRVFLVDGWMHIEGVLHSHQAYLTGTPVGLWPRLAVLSGCRVTLSTMSVLICEEKRFRKISRSRKRIPLILFRQSITDRMCVRRTKLGNLLPTDEGGIYLGEGTEWYVISI